MKIDKGLLLFGAPIPIQGLGRILSPKLKDVFNGFDSYASFSLIRTVMATEKDKIRTIIKGLNLTQDYSDLTDLDFDESSKFSIITHSHLLREFFRQSLDMFFVEDVVWFEDHKCYVTQNKDEKLVGVISNDNYSEVEDLLKQMVGDSSGSGDNLRFATPEAKRLWEEHNTFEQASPKSISEDYSLPNIISKLACGTTGYTLFSIFDLTVYQLFDQFQAYSQCRSSALSENAYAHWGGEDFDPFSWLRSQQS